MKLGEQLEILVAHQVELVAIGGLAGVLRQATSPPAIDVIVRATAANAGLVAALWSASRACDRIPISFAGGIFSSTSTLPRGLRSTSIRRSSLSRTSRRRAGQTETFEPGVARLPLPARSTWRKFRGQRRGDGAS